MAEDSTGNLAEASDGPRISQENLCEIVGVTPAMRRRWADRHHLEKRGGDGYLEYDAVELAALRALDRCLPSTEAQLAWEQLREMLGENLDLSAPLLAAYDRQDKKAGLIVTLADLVDFSEYGHPVLVIDFGDPIKRVRSAFARLVKQRENTGDPGEK